LNQSYFYKGKLIFILRKEEDFPYDEKLSGLDYSKLELGYENRYYFYNENLIKVNKSSKGRYAQTYSSNIVSILVGVEEANKTISDEYPFSDGSIPSPWIVAGFFHPVEFRKFLVNLRENVLMGNKEEVIKVLDEKRFSKTEVLKNYDSIFNTKVINSFKDLNTKEIFRNYQGAMIGRGTVWFEEKPNGKFEIISINNKEL
jgi:superoxide dismutase